MLAADGVLVTSNRLLIIFIICGDECSRGAITHVRGADVAIVKISINLRHTAYRVDGLGYCTKYICSVGYHTSSQNAS